MERKIGEIFEYNDEWYQAVKSQGKCSSCDLFVDGHCISDLSLNGSCFSPHRKDKEEIMFKKLEKVGEPFVYEKRTCQTYKLHTPTDLKIQPDEVRSISIDRGNYTADIEIKQNKEDMGEKSLNLKPFDLEKAKAGKPVCTRDGRKARIICFDRDWDMHIVALVADPLGESVHYYLSNGKVDFDRQLDDDLMMLPEKKEGWVNVYYNKIDGITFSKHPHTSKEEAIKEAGGTLSGRIDTVKISWEE